MGDQDTSPGTCLSAESHEPRDPLMHYLGCLEFCDRKGYLNSLEEGRKEAHKQVKTELRRIKYLRNVLKSDPDPDIPRLLQNLENSMVAWRCSRLYDEKGTIESGTKGINAVRAWRTANCRENGQSQQDLEPEPPPANEACNPDRDNDASQQDLEPESPPANEAYHPDRDINAYLISYEHSKPRDNLSEEGFSGHFPNHKMSVFQLLNSKNKRNLDPLRRAAVHSNSESLFNYFHLPANNMNWIEKAISRYFGEDNPDKHSKDHAASEQSKVQTLLSPQCWKGQQHGGSSAEIHARHLRPLCEMVSSSTTSDPEMAETSPKHVVLFMPFLHWETDRQRENVSRFLEKEEDKHRRAKQSEEERETKSRRCARGELTIPKFEKPVKSVFPSDSEAQPKPAQAAHLHGKSLSQLLANSLPPKSRKHLQSTLFKSDKNGRVLTKKDTGAVGQVLIDAARLYEAMTTYRDKMFIQEYLYKDPPLHPRRTLDQAYYWTLKSTAARDRDQVVYRGTKPTLSHTIHADRREWNCFDDDMDSKERNKDHHQLQHGRACVHCKTDIRKVSRLLMVDQLWMWILDEKTIITAFPKRYGMNKQDPSGVHKSIRDRLRNLKPGHIRTVFDLALIILDDCSTIFFDHTKTADRQPQTLDIFSETIGKINNKTTISYQHLWDWTQNLSKLASPAALPADLSQFVAPVLNISAESGLQREIKDVIDELDIMLYLQSQQLNVMKTFKKEVELLLADSDRDKQFSPGASPTSPISANAENTSPRRRWFAKKSEELLNGATDRTERLKGLRQSAESVSASLENLLALKQQQASVFQAWQSVHQAEEAVRQGRAIMIFTVITIVFLPLSFIAGVFGMNNQQISGSGGMTLQQQFRLMFPISIGVIIVVLIFAYSSFVRTLVWLAYRYLITLVLVKTPIYDRIYLSLDWRSASITRKVEQRVLDMKLLVKKNKGQRIRQNLRAIQEAEREEEAREKTREVERTQKKHAENGHSSVTTAIPTFRGIHPRHDDTTSPEHFPQGLHPGGGSSTSRRRPPLLSPPSARMISEGAQTTPSLLEEGYKGYSM